MAVTRPTESDVLNSLRGVIDPELGRNIVELKMARSAAIDADGRVVVTIALTTSGCPLRAQIQRDAKARIESIPGVSEVRFNWDVMTQDQKSETMDIVRRRASEDATETAIPPTTRVLAIASGKGGVGKSSVTANLAAALANRGLNIGLIDADIWGFSIPRMLGIDGRLEAEQDGERSVITPHRLEVGTGRIDLVSMGFLVEDEESALLWRGLMLNRAVQHFLEDVRWDDDLDYLLIDMPPGTGDVALGLAKMLPRAELIIVTTPATGAQKVATRAVTMARKSYMRVAGVIENMSAFVNEQGTRYELFGSGGGAELAESAGIPLLGQIPIEPEVSRGGDEGRPAALGTGPAADAFTNIAALIVDTVAPPIAMDGCSARMVAMAEAALDAFDAAEADGSTATS